MVTGFNTDVQHRGKTYHVQTEDKGLQNPIIETLIYMGGEILAARRTSYADLLEKEVDEKEIGERIEAQHNRMILDIREGKYHSKQIRPFGEGIISNKSFDEVVLDWLKSQTATERIALQMIGSDGFVEGGTARLELFVSRPSTSQGVAGAKVKVKLISTVAKPRTLVEGTTDEAGRVTLSCPLPLLEEGTAALIVQASSGKESAEIKQLIKKPARKAAG
ncbi:MAG: hypothetical protein AUI52_01040 [Acidobacteria bacterium 13_1_40CM_2_68_10]|nr:MAG: hypothetical protein AUI52_01040 [Acidobacteria bacterium 13_1_40CM_2_68_10]OLE65992.1 MAG: hypothetical protein AUG03_01920 [Acidobacteria bacterium 13_1_20CM_2_68_14]